MQGSWTATDRSSFGQGRGTQLILLHAFVVFERVAGSTPWMDSDIQEHGLAGKAAG